MRPVSLEGAADAAHAWLIDPILVGPAARVRAVALEGGLGIAALTIIETEHHPGQPCRFRPVAARVLRRRITHRGKRAPQPGQAVA